MFTLRPCSVFAATLASLALSPAALIAGPTLSYDPDAGAVRLVRKSDVGAVSSRFRLEARGRQQVGQAYTVVAGVLFQATARPDRSLEALPIGLSYRLIGDHDAALDVSIGGHNVVSETPAWVWAVAARFADQAETAAVTLSGRPETPDEKRFARQWRNADERLFWARYHPAVDDTLIGFFLIAADAMMADAQRMRTVTVGLRDLESYAGYMVEFDEVTSRRAARALDTSITHRPTLRWYAAMLNDVDESFVFGIGTGGLRISGTPNYHFARKTPTGAFEEITQLTGLCRTNRHLLYETNSLLYTAVDDFARHVAFFNYVDETDPNELDRFLDRLQPVFERIPTIETPIALPMAVR